MTRVRYRPATHDDQTALAALLRDAPMEGWVRLQLLREPDYFAADALMGTSLSLFVETETETETESDPPDPVGMCRLSRLPVHVNGVAAEAGYLAGLRILPRFRHRLAILREGFAALRKQALPEEPLPACFTSVGAGNAPARRILEATLPQMPAYSPLGSMHTLSFASTRGQAGNLLRPATAADIPALASFFNAQASAWQFAAYLSEDWLAALGPTQGLAISDFLLAEDATGIRACLALWDQRAVKQTRIAGYATPLDRLRRLWNLAARLSGRIALPAAGEQLDQAYLAFFASALPEAQSITVVREALWHLQQRGIAVGVLGLAATHPLCRPLQRALAATVYETCIESVSFPGETAPELDRRAPQPEIALL